MAVILPGVYLIKKKFPTHTETFWLRNYIAKEWPSKENDDTGLCLNTTYFYIELTSGSRVSVSARREGDIVIEPYGVMLTQETTACMLYPTDH